MFRKLFFAMVLSVCAFAAFALPKPSEVKAAFTSGNYTLAERLLNEVMVEKPTAMVHYQLGQVYAAQGKHVAALNEYRQAQTLDPLMKFASSPSAFLQLMSNEQVAVEKPVARSNVITTTAQVPVSAPYSGPSAMSVIGVMLLFAAIAGAIVFVINKRKKMAEQEEIDAAVAAKKNTLVGLAKNLEDAVLIAKTSNHTDAMKTRLLDNIGSIQSRVRTGLAELKDTKDMSASRVQALVDAVETATTQAATGIPAPSKSEYVRPRPKAEPGIVGSSNTYTSSGRSSSYRSPSPAPAPQVEHHYHTPVQNSNNDLLTGVLIGEALSSHRDRTVYVERNNGFDQGNSRNNSYEAPTPAPAPVWDEPVRRSSPAPGAAEDDSWGSSSSSSIDSSSSSDDSY